MTFQLFDLIIIVNKCLGISPPIRETNVFNKIYAVLVVILLTVGKIISYRYKDYLNSYTHMKRVISILMDLISYLFNCYAVLSTTFRHEEQWKKLLKTNKSDGNFSKRVLYFLGFLSLNIIVCSIVVASNYAFTEIVVRKTLEDIVLIDVEIYTQFIFGCLICSITNILLSKYRHLTHLLNSHLRNIRTKPTSSDDLLEKIGSTAYLLKENVDSFNQIFGIPLLLLISYATLHFVNYIDDFFFFGFAEDKFQQFFAANVCFVAMIFLGNVALISMCARIQEEASKVVNCAYKLKKVLPSVASRQRSELDEFINYSIYNFPKFSAAGYFLIEKTTIFRILSTITTLLIVMVQFDMART